MKKALLMLAAILLLAVPLTAEDGLLGTSETELFLADDEPVMTPSCTAKSGELVVELPNFTPLAAAGAPCDDLCACCRNFGHQYCCDPCASCI